MFEKKVKKIKKIKKVAETNVVKKVATQNIKDYSSNEKISFCRVTDLNKEDYKNFTSEKYKYGMIFYDFEVFAYDWLVVFIDVIRNKKTIIVNDRPSFLRFYQEHRNEIFSGYNSRQYDTTIAKSIILGLDVKEVNDKLIIDGLKPFQISDKFKDVKWYDYDCLPNGTFISLKTKEGFMGDDIRETEVDFNLDRTLTKEEIEDTIYYCNHDVEETIKVFQKEAIGKYQAHMGLIEMYNLNLNCINKTSAQIVAIILGTKRGTHDDSDMWDIVLPPNLEVKRYKYIVDWFMSEENHDLSKSLNTTVMGLPHTFGWGGAHGASNKPMKYSGGNIWHVDVNSYYPSLLIFSKVFPEDRTIGELAFGDYGANVYKEIYEKRLELKKQGKKKEQAPLKVVLNGTYGILRDKNSSAYYPRGAGLISAYGQMYLVDLLEHLEDAKCCELIQSNTDGLILKCKNKEQVEIMDTICKDWEKRTLMGLARDEISWMVQKDVNNYVFMFENGKYERKGAYVKELSELDNDLPIVNNAIVEHICNKTNIEDYVNNCDELIKFQKVVRLSSCYKNAYHNGEILHDKTYRIFASKNIKDSCIGKQKEGNTTIEKFANTPEHAIIINEDVHDKKCSDYNIDKKWYIDLIYKRLEDYGIDCKPNIFDMF